MMHNCFHFYPLHCEESQNLRHQCICSTFNYLQLATLEIFLVGSGEVENGEWLKSGDGSRNDARKEAKWDVAMT